MADYSTLEKLYTRGVLDIIGKDFLTDTQSALPVNTERDTFLPDSRFVRVDGPYMRTQLDKDMFQKTNEFENPITNQPYNSFNNTNNTKSNDINDNNKLNKVKNFFANKITAGIIGSLALILSGRYILKKLHILK